MVFAKNPKYGIAFLLGFGMAMQYLLGFFRYVIEPKEF
jgi:hypothetical protein